MASRVPVFGRPILSPVRRVTNAEDGRHCLPVRSTLRVYFSRTRSLLVTKVNNELKVDEGKQSTTKHESDLLVVATEASGDSNSMSCLLVSRDGKLLNHGGKLSGDPENTGWQAENLGVQVLFKANNCADHPEYLAAVRDSGSSGPWTLKAQPSERGRPDEEPIRPPHSLFDVTYAQPVFKLKASNGNETFVRRDNTTLIADEKQADAERFRMDGRDGACHLVAHDDPGGDVPDEHYWTRDSNDDVRICGPCAS